MSIEAAAVVVRRSRGRMVVQIIGQSPRGQRYIKDEVALNSEKIGAQDFKTELAETVDKVLGIGA